MKQNITEDQLGKLSNKGKKRLKKWVADGYAHSPLLTIGELISFLGENWKFINIAMWENKRWSVSDTTHANRRYAVELCDALWGAVKGILGPAS